jgi:hypothetical protein
LVSKHYEKKQAGVEINAGGKFVSSSLLRWAAQGGRRAMD